MYFYMEFYPASLSRVILSNICWHYLLQFYTVLSINFLYLSYSLFWSFISV